MKNKKGFTIVELVIVIAVIAILASVLVPTFSNIILKAQVSADTQVVKILNEDVAIDLAENGMYRHDTMYDAVQACVKQGLSPEKIAAKSNLDIAWNSVTGRFVLLDKEANTVVYPEDGEYVVENNEMDYFIVTSYDSSISNENYLFSTYAYGNDWPSEVEVHTGFDAGNVQGIKKLTYKELVINFKKVIIRTNEFSTKLFVDGSDYTEIAHYGYAGVVDISRVANSSLDEYGVVGKANIDAGHLNALGESVICHIDLNYSESSVSVGKNTTVYDKYGNLIEDALDHDKDKFANGPVVMLASISSTCMHDGNTKIITDTKTYEVCIPCGNTLVTIYDEDTHEVFRRTVIVDDEIELIPMVFYSTKQVVDGTFSKDTGSVEIKTDKKGELVEPSISQQETMTTNQKKCKHENLTYSVGKTPNTHICKCNSCDYSFTASHNFVDGKCADCGYQCDHYTKSYVGVACDQAGDGTTTCKLCGHSETIAYQANEHLWCEGTHTCLRNTSAAAYSIYSLDYSESSGSDKGFISEIASERTQEAMIFYSSCGDTFSIWKGENNTVIPMWFVGYDIMRYYHGTYDLNGKPLDFHNYPNIIIQEGITALGSEAFHHNYYLANNGIKSIDIASSVEDLGSYPFKACRDLTEVIFRGDKITKIPDGSFCACTALEEITLPDSVTEIGENVFYWCFNITKFNLPANLEILPADTIGRYSNEKVKPLEPITLPKSLKSIGESQFKGSLLKDIYYLGTKAEWEELTKNTEFHFLCECTAHCTDGDIVIDDQRHYIYNDDDYVKAEVTYNGVVYRFDWIYTIRECTDFYSTPGVYINMLKYDRVGMSFYEGGFDFTINTNGIEGIEIDFIQTYHTYTVYTEVINETTTRYYTK